MLSWRRPGSISAVDTGLRRYDNLFYGGGWRKCPICCSEDVPEHVIAALERQAVLHGRSPEAEHRSILDAALRAGFWERAAALREETRGRIFTPSEELIRQDRDE